jgi:DNA-binding transcriptional LysR family regulator
MEVSFDLRLLRMFIAVAETGAVSKSAQRLARTQAAVSMQLQRIEKELETQLLIRSSRGVSLTDAGETFLAYSRKMIALTDDMQRRLSDKTLAGRVRIGMFEDLAVTRLPAAIAQFKCHHPSVEIELTSSYSEELARSLKDGRSDIVVADPVRFTGAPRSFISRQLVWCASRMMELEVDAALPIIIFESTCSWQDRMLASLAETGTNWKVGCRVENLSAMLSALRAGLGIGILFPEAIPPDCENIGRKYGLPPAPDARFGVYVCDKAPPLVEELATYLQGGF